MTEAIFFHITNTCVYIMSQTTRICLYKNQTTLPRCSLGPANGPPLLRGCGLPPRRHLSTVTLRLPAPLALGYRRLCSPVAPPPSRPPARLATPFGRLGRLRHSVLRLALGLLRVGLRPTLRATAGSPPALLRRCLGGSPPRRPRPRPALPRPSVGWPPGRAAGSAPPARGLERPLRSAFSGHRPRALLGEDKCSREIAG